MSLMSLLFTPEKPQSTEDFVKLRAPISGITDGDNYGFKRKIAGDHVYMEAGQGQAIIFCHGIFGSFKNFAQIGQRLSNKYRIIVPCMPMYDAPFSKCTVEELSLYLESFINDLNLDQVILAGNSMGGGTILLYSLRNPQKVSKLMLFASSGLSFIPMRGGAMKLKSREYVYDLIKDIFHCKPPFSDQEFEEVYQVMQNKATLLRILNFTRSTKRNFLHDELHKLHHPALILWGKQDTVTPPFVAEEFLSHLKNSELHYIDSCGHVPTYERPQECGDIIEGFLNK